MVVVGVMGSLERTFRIKLSSTVLGDKLAHIYMIEGKISRADRIYKTMMELNNNYESSMLYLIFSIRSTAFA